ncbi:hypothetical protein FRC01_008062 [Tulasnella sp. 417]|nr:hypothetical protein FRC01_008062 [Tulasnella sp. 417]
MPAVNLDCIQNVKDNNEDLMSFAATVRRFHDTITSPLQTVKISAPWAMTTELQQRLTVLTNELTSMSSKTEKLLSRGRFQKFLMNQEDAGVIAELNRELDRVVQAFMLKGAIVTEITIKETHQTVEQGFARTEVAIQETKTDLQDVHNELSKSLLMVAASTERTGSGLQDMREETMGGFSQVLSDVGKTEDAVHSTREELSRKLDIVSDNLLRSDVASINHQSKLLSAAQLQLLRDLPRAQARYDSQSRGDARGCFEGTRKNTLNEIYTWINSQDPNTPPIFWLCGLAGIGKSTIAHTIAAEEEQKHRLGASFFFSRDEADRRNPLLVYPSIAYQLAVFNPDLKRLVAEALEQDPDVGLAVMRKQFQKLIAEPLAAWEGKKGTLVIVMDALDECYPESGAEEILVRWAAELRRLAVPLKILITSRPELHIRAKFQSPSLRLISQPYILHDIEKSIVQADIELFLRHTLNAIAEDHGIPTPWPTDFELRVLVKRADILFIFAATAIKFIAGGKRRDPQARLNTLLKREAPKSTSKYQEVDSLYTQVLQHAVTEEEDDEDDAETTRRIFRSVLETIVLLRDPLSSGSLEALLSLKKGTVRSAITHLHSVLVVPEILDGQIRVFHPSFQDFLTNPKRCIDPQFYLNPEESQTRLASLCLRRMLATLKGDPCGIKNPWLYNSEVPNLRTRVEGAISPHIRYCCLHFASHLSQASPSDVALADLVVSFCKTKLLAWIETLSLIGDVDSAIPSLQMMRGWYKRTPSATRHNTDLLHDAHRIVLQFAAGIRQSSGHIYTSALPFSPPCVLKEQYASAIPLNYVLRGQPSTWDTCVCAIEDSDALWSVAYSADGERIVAGSSAGPVRVLSGSTGAELALLEGHTRGVRSVAFSNDGSRVASAAEDSTAKIWDITTGMLLATLSEHTDVVTFISFVSEDGMVLTASDDGTIRSWHSITGAPLSCRSGHDCEISGGALSPDGSIIATVTDTAIGIWELDQDEPLNLLMGESKDYASVAFLPDNVRLVSGSYSRVVCLWDYRAGTSLKVFKVQSDVTSLAIAQNGALMAIPYLREAVQLWDTETWSPMGLLEGHLNGVQSLSFSPDCSTLASASDDSTVRLWDCKGSLPTAPESSKVESSHGHAWLAASADGSCVVSVSGKRRAMKIWSLKSNSTPRTISMEEDSDFVLCSPDGRMFASDGLAKDLGVYDEQGYDIDSQRLRLWDASDLKCLATWSVDRPGGASGHGSAIFSQDGRLLASSLLAPGLQANEVSVWCTESFNQKSTFKNHHNDDIVALAFSTDNTHLFFASMIGYGIWDIPSGAQLVAIDAPGPATALACTYFADNMRIFCLKRLKLTVNGAELAARVIDSTTLSEIDDLPCSRTARIEGGVASYSLVFLEDKGDSLYLSGRSGSVRLCWLPQAWRVAGRVKDIVWSGRFLVFGLEGGDVGALDFEALRQTAQE